MILYHGSNVIVDQPELVQQNRFLDFGFGFYTTTNKSQAVSFADKVTKRRRMGQRAVSIYKIDEATAFSECSILRFDKPDEAWLDFVSNQRSGNYTIMMVIMRVKYAILSLGLWPMMMCTGH